MKNISIRILALLLLVAFAACGGSSVDGALEGNNGVDSSASAAEVVFLQPEGELFIRGVVFNDVNRDGVMNTCEPGIDGATVQLAEDIEGLPWESFVATADWEDFVTTAGGTYAFAVSTGKNYWVVENDLAGYASSVDEFFIEEIQDDQTVDFADETIHQSYSICGTVFKDLDGNGVMDAENPEIPGVTVTLSRIGEAVTDSAGAYAFAFTTTGPYTVTAIAPLGYRPTTSNPEEVTVEEAIVKGDPLFYTVDFGFQPYLEVSVDVKPCNDFNPVNLKSQGVLPTAILGRSDFEVEKIDVSTLFLAGVAPLRANFGDVCEDEECEEGEVPEDDYPDLILKFDTPAIADTLMAAYPDLARGDTVTLDFEGALEDETALVADPPVGILIVQVPK